MNSNNIKIGIIGTGNMGHAIIKGIASRKTFSQLTAFDIDKSRLEKIQSETNIKIAESPGDLLLDTNVLILSVKPDITVETASQLTQFNGLIVSVAAGISIQTLQSRAGSDKKIIRAMPNTPASSGCGMTVLSPSENVKFEESELIKTIFSSFGEVLVMDEKHMNAVTAISGCGPAYIFTLIQAMADGGVKLGIPRADALLLAGQTILGSAKMFLDKKENPIKLRDNVTSPGGSTIAALHIFEKAGFNGIIIDAIEAAAFRAKELDKS